MRYGELSPTEMRTSRRAEAPYQRLTVDGPQRRSDRRQFRCTRTAGAICVRIVRNGPRIGFQGLGADGCGGIGLVTVRSTVPIRPPASRWSRNGVISGSDNADGADGRAPTFSGAEADGTGSAFAPECYLDADLAQEGCRPAQPAREGTRRVPWSPDPNGSSPTVRQNRCPSMIWVKWPTR